MSYHKNCPECGKNISGLKRCTCGWQKEEDQNVVDHGCQYTAKGRRCKLPGSMSLSTHGGGKWYCPYHYRSLGDPKQAEELLDEIERNYDTIMEERIDWRRKLFPEDFIIIKKDK